MKLAERLLRQALDRAEIAVNGRVAWDIQVHDQRFWSSLWRGSLGIGEAYMAGWWDCKQVDELVCRLAKSGQGWIWMLNPIVWQLAARNLLANMVPGETEAEAIGEAHYDLGNSFYEAMLGRSMIYSCAYWSARINYVDSSELEESQWRKMRLVGKKLGLHRGMDVLDIGCGWGTGTKHLAELCAARIFGVTVSKEQVKYAAEHACSSDVTFGLGPWQNLSRFYGPRTGKKFDRIYSLGAFEHFGWKNYRHFFQEMQRLFKPDGRLLLHTIGKESPVCFMDPWLHKYIFPNGMIPSRSSIERALPQGLHVWDWHALGGWRYDATLMRWYANFLINWGRIRAENPYLDEGFYRMWEFYLLSCAGLFRAGKLDVWQILLGTAKKPTDYQPVR